MGLYFVGFFFLTFWLLCAACGILALWPGAEPVPASVEVLS